MLNDERRMMKCYFEIQYSIFDIHHFNDKIPHHLISNVEWWTPNDEVFTSIFKIHHFNDKVLMPNNIECWTLNAEWWSIYFDIQNSSFSIHHFIVLSWNSLPPKACKFQHKAVTHWLPAYGFALYQKNYTFTFEKSKNQNLWRNLSRPVQMGPVRKFR